MSLHHQEHNQQQQHHQQQEHHHQDDDDEQQVIVAGAGICGSWATLQLARRGAHVLLLEQVEQQLSSWSVEQSNDSLTVSSKILIFMLHSLSPFHTPVLYLLLTLNHSRHLKFSMINVLHPVPPSTQQRKFSWPESRNQVPFFPGVNSVFGVVYLVFRPLSVVFWIVYLVLESWQKSRVR